MALEVEIKSLLGSKENADAFKEKLLADSTTCLVYKGKSINHYFINPTSFDLFISRTGKFFSDEKHKTLESIVRQAKEISVRTRETETEVRLVIKASVDDTTSSNGIARMEFEEKVDLSLEGLDQFLITCGFKYQAKWSRIREEYKYREFNVCLDKNAGYGYLTEFELMIEDISGADKAKEKLKAEITKFGLVELGQDRLGRMFDHYNKHWPEYYGTEKVFNIE